MWFIFHRERQLTRPSGNMANVVIGNRFHKVFTTYPRMLRINWILKAILEKIESCIKCFECHEFYTKGDIFTSSGVLVLKQGASVWWCFCFAHRWLVGGRRLQAVKQPLGLTRTWRWKPLGGMDLMVGFVNAPLWVFISAETWTNISIITAETWWVPSSKPRCSTQHVWALSCKGHKLLLKHG